MKVSKVKAHGFCHGVVRAVNKLDSIIKANDGEKTIYLIGNFIHNPRFVSEYKGKITIKNLNDDQLFSWLASIDKTKSIIVLSAHGSKSSIINFLNENHFNYHDLVCDRVEMVMNLIKDFSTKNIANIYIGKKGHQETEACLSHDHNLKLVTSIKDVESLDKNIKYQNILNQTTFDHLELLKIVKAIKDKYPTINFIDNICDATKKRQVGLIKAIKDDVDYVIVVGDQTSNNCVSLIDICKKNKVKAVLISSVEQLDFNDIKKCHHVLITSGASCPEQYFNEVYEKLLELQ